VAPLSAISLAASQTSPPTVPSGLLLPTEPLLPEPLLPEPPLQLASVIAQAKTKSFRMIIPFN
jgi:hypothetical protein